METKEYFEKVMRDFNQKRRDRNIFCGLDRLALVEIVWGAFFRQ